jgi:hypothetical protein
MEFSEEFGCWESGHSVSSPPSQIGPFYQRVEVTGDGAPREARLAGFGDLDSVSTTRSEKIFGLFLLDFGQMAYSICLALL